MTTPLLRDFPDHFETARLIVRCPRPGDGTLIHPAVLASKAELEPWMPWARGEYTLEMAETYVRNAQALFLRRESLPMLIFRQPDQVFIGGTGLHDIEWDVPRFEIGYWQATPHTGQGYMTEAVLGLTNFCREQFGAIRMVIRCDSRNDRSRRVAERAGYVLESVALSDRRGSDDHQLRDTLTFAKTWPD
jgi:RimJ/RimL family protein N-acetyltransferase